MRDNTDEVDRIVEALGDKCAGIYSGMQPHSPREDVIEAANLARAANTDLLVTIGGGSLTDAGKSVTMCLEFGIDTAAGMTPYRAGTKTGAEFMEQFTGKVRQVAIPTTLSGGEFSGISGVTDTTRTPIRKEGFVHPLFQPVMVIFDPKLTLYTPEWLFLSTGVRAVDHCVEGICSVQRNHYSSAQAAAALRLLVRALPRVKRDSNDMDARLQCQVPTGTASSSSSFF